MGWSNTHLHQFIIRSTTYGIAYEGGITFSDNPNAIRLKDFQFHPLERFVYEYNFFAHWELEIRVEKALALENEKIHPICIGGRRKAPDEDCGGALSFMKLSDYYTPWRLEEMLLKYLKYHLSKKENDEDFEEMLRTIIYWANQHSFNRRYVNNLLKKFAIKDPSWKDCYE